MEEKNQCPKNVIEEILAMYGFSTAFSNQTEYIVRYDEKENRHVKVILSVSIGSGERLVLKILREEQGNPHADREIIERQSAFSEFLRNHGVRTPKRYVANGRYCNPYVFQEVVCNVTVEDWCGEEIREIDRTLAYRIGALLARMHTLSIENQCTIGCGTLFSAAHKNDVDAYADFCKICEDERLDRACVKEICRLREEKIGRIRKAWDRLPKAAVQGDISINNLADGNGELIVFDYNNAGDEVLVSDLVLEGLLTAYEMDLPQGTDRSECEALFSSFLEGYLSNRELSEVESEIAWEIYTLYHALWFSKILYRADSLDKSVERGDYATANRLLKTMLAQITENDDGRFRKTYR